jgi:hypothetical protein
MEEVAQISGAHVLVAEIGGKAILRSPGQAVTAAAFDAVFG